MAVDYSERIQTIEFVNVFPSMNGDGHVFLMTAITDKMNRVLVYAPMVKVGDHQINSGWEEESDWYTSLYNIRRRRYCQFITDLFAVKNTDNSFEYFKIMYLDGKFVPQVKKEDVEKLFGCDVIG